MKCNDESSINGSQSGTGSNGKSFDDVKTGDSELDKILALQNCDLQKEMQQSIAVGEYSLFETKPCNTKDAYRGAPVYSKAIRTKIDSELKNLGEKVCDDTLEKKQARINKFAIPNEEPLCDDSISPVPTLLTLPKDNFRGMTYGELQYDFPLYDTQNQLDCTLSNEKKAKDIFGIQDQWQCRSFFGVNSTLMAKDQYKMEVDEPILDELQYPEIIPEEQENTCLEGCPPPNMY